MKELLEDYRREGFTLREWVIYGVLYPLGLIGVVLLGGLFETL